MIYRVHTVRFGKTKLTGPEDHKLLLRAEPLVLCGGICGRNQVGHRGF